MGQIKALRSPNINAQIIQQGLEKYRDLFSFLARQHTQLAGEIAQAYSNTMRWYYLHHFSRYREALDKLSLYRTEKGHVLGSDPAVPKGTRSRYGRGARLTSQLPNQLPS